MLKQKIYKGLREIPFELQRFLRRSYPAFVTANEVQSLDGEVPVFMFHTVDDSIFGRQLEFLKVNGYQTLTLKTFMAFLRGDVQLKEPSVLLTFDDGEKSWYRVAYPMLKRYGFHGVGFVVPYYLKERPDKTASKGWLSWREIAEMDRSGAIDIQSHTYYHDRIFIEPKLVDFFHTGFNHNPLSLDAPWIEESGSYTNQLKYGTPVYRYASRLEDHPRYIDNERVRLDCISWVESQGGGAFFLRPQWRKDLKGFYEMIIGKQRRVHYESYQEQRAKISEDLIKAKDILEERLNKKIQHLCYPWGVGSTLSVRLSQEAGYISNFWGTLSYRRSNKNGDSPFYIPRLKDDYLFRLPGRRRKPLIEIFKMKLRRRIQKVDLY